MIDLDYWTTPNGHKITMFLEETGTPKPAGEVKREYLPDVRKLGSPKQGSTAGLSGHVSLCPVPAFR